MSNTIRRCLPGALALALLLPAVASAQEWAGRGRLSGTVEDDATGKPIEGAKVTLHPAANPEVGPEPMMTNKKGKFSILGLTGGEWTVMVEAEGYVPSQGSVKVTEFGAGPNIPIKLRKPTQEELRQTGAGQAVEAIERGNSLMQSNDWAGARAAYEEALEKLGTDDTSSHPAILRGIARTYFQEQNTAKAIETLERALAIAPDDPDTNQLMVNLLIADGREDEAEQYMSKLPEGSKLDPNALLNMGIQHYNSGEMEKALEYFTKAVAENPEVPEGYYFRGLAYMNQGKNAEAKADFQKLLEIAPDHEKAAEAKEFLSYLEQGSGQ